jgi:hypothetical protein
MTFICPDGLDTAWYRTFVPEIPIEHVDGRWLATPSMLAACKISPLLYEKYERFEYILFYEPDAFVFSDRLEEWCDRDLDYLGAPWFEGFSKPKSDRIIGAGNGGFSLRKVQSHLRIARRFELEQALFRGGYRRHPSQKLWFVLAQVSRMLGIGKGRRYYVSPPYPRSEGVHGAEAGSLFSSSVSLSGALIQFRSKAETSLRDELPSASLRMSRLVQVRSGLLEAVHRGVRLRRSRRIRAGTGAMTMHRPPHLCGERILGPRTGQTPMSAGGGWRRRIRRIGRRLHAIAGK